jgi:hypothetical protein
MAFLEMTAPGKGCIRSVFSQTERAIILLFVYSIFKYCCRHSQMNARLFEAFEARAEHVKEYMAGCGQKYGMPCTCGPACRCENCSEHCKQNRADAPGRSCHNNNSMAVALSQMQNGVFNDHYGGGMMGGPPPQISTTNMNSFGGGGDPMGQMHVYGGASGMNGELSPLGGAEDEIGMPHNRVEMSMRGGGRRASRNPSIISFGGVRGMSVSSEATFGRAMSGLSALSIDWENLEDFDVNVDHSAHINNGGSGAKRD